MKLLRIGAAVCIAIFVSQSDAAKEPPKKINLVLLRGGLDESCNWELLNQRYRPIGRVLSVALTNVTFSFDDIIEENQRTRLSVSDNGEFFAVKPDDDHFEVRETREGNVIYRGSAENSQFKHISIDGVSNDGHFIAITRAYRQGGQIETIIRDMSSKFGKYSYRSKGDPVSYQQGGVVVRLPPRPPKLSFFDSGFMALYFSRVETFDFEGRRTRFLPVETGYAVDRAPGLEHVSLVADARHLNDDRSFIFILHGPPPLRLDLRTGMKYFEDGRADGSMAKYSGYEYGIGQSGRYVMQLRYSGAGTGHYKSYYDIFTRDGKLFGTIEPPHAAEKAAIRFDDERIAIAMMYAGEKEPEIWIYAMNNLKEPLQVLPTSGLSTIDYLAFTKRGSLIVGSTISNLVLSFDPIPD